MSLSAAETAQVILAPTAVPRDAAEKMLRYLVFHRSLLGEAEDTSVLLERYLTLVQNLKEGVHLVIPDPFQKATALLFELVMDQEFDPWEIDLVKFTQAYLDRVKEEGGVNFAIAGRLVYMAWSILYLQSEVLLRSRDTPPDPVADPTLDAGGAISDDGYLPLLETPEAVDVTSAVLGSTAPPPLLEMVRHPETRPVSSSSWSAPSERPRSTPVARSGSRSFANASGRSSAHPPRSSSTATSPRSTSSRYLGGGPAATPSRRAVPAPRPVEPADRAGPPGRDLPLPACSSPAKSRSSSTRMCSESPRSWLVRTSEVRGRVVEKE